ncbi:hypothetical protein CDD83_5634 [Cordyceps sp. RAO-2017]|nr:hypothetical protein CDD83_5634 [Cordyceps sp. RAO-2017]
MPAVASEFETTATVTNLAVAMYLLSMSIFPLWWSSFSEQFGRRSIYLISFGLFAVFAAGCGASSNAAMLVVLRVLTGGASASVQAVGAGTIADLWEPHERGRAMSTFYLGPLLGPLVAPIVGGALAQQFGWRACMYLLAVYGALILLLLFFLLPETLPRRAKADRQQQQQPPPPPHHHHPSSFSSSSSSGDWPAPLRRATTVESARVRTRRLAAGAKRFVVDPLRVLLFLRFPPVLITVLVAAIAFGALYVANVAIQQKFSAPPTASFGSSPPSAASFSASPP